MEQSPTSVADLDFAACADKIYKEYINRKCKASYLAKRLGGQTHRWVTKDEWAMIMETRQQGLHALRALQVTEDVPPLVLHVPRKRKAMAEAKAHTTEWCEKKLMLEKEHEAWIKAREPGGAENIDVEQALQHPGASLGVLTPSAPL